MQNMSDYWDFLVRETEEMFTPKIDHVDQLIRFMEALAKLGEDQRQMFIDALDNIINRPEIIESHTTRFT